MTLDNRVNAYRPDLADIRLEGQLEADQFRPGEPAILALSNCGLRCTPDITAGYSAEALYGEAITVFDRADDWAWIQSQRDNYVGYVPENAVADLPTTNPTHQVSVAQSHFYSKPDLKTQPTLPAYLTSHLRIVGHDGDWAQLHDGRYIYQPHIAEIETHHDDPATIAELFLHTPYLWGGKTAAGLDCSGLVQLAFQACGYPAPRDSDMQAANFGTPLSKRDELTRNDLVFWRGHVGIMLDETHLLHANGHHMMVAIEPLDEAITRITTTSFGKVTGYRRP